MRNADRGLRNTKRWAGDILTFAPFVLLSLNFAHFREDSSRATEALPRRFADTPIRRHADTIAVCGCGYAAL
jgi:hypothetical protein